VLHPFCWRLSHDGVVAVLVRDVAHCFSIFYPKFYFHKFCRKKKYKEEMKKEERTNFFL
jgi:hypothetical protein